MISFVQGILAEVHEDTVVIEAGSLGWEIFVPGTMISRLPQTGSEVRLYTWLQVREDGMALFGFLTPDDREVFKLLLRVNGVGPKAAMGVLSALTPDEFRFAVLADDEKTIMRAPGLGRKTAQKIILELKDKLDLADAFEKKRENDHPSAPDAGEAAGEAVQALTALGYTAGEALRAVRSLTVTPEMDAGQILKLALRQLTS